MTRRRSLLTTASESSKWHTSVIQRSLSSRQVAGGERATVLARTPRMLDWRQSPLGRAAVAASSGCSASRCALYAAAYRRSLHSRGEGAWVRHERGSRVAYTVQGSWAAWAAICSVSSCSEAAEHEGAQPNPCHNCLSRT